MKSFTVIFILLLSTSQLFSQEHYSRVRIPLEITEVQQIQALGIDLGNGSYKPGVYVEAEISAYDMQLLQNEGIAFEVLIEDMTAWYQARIEATKDYKLVRNLNERYPIPENWELGSMGGFYTYDQIIDKLDFMAEQWPDLISARQPISETYSVQGYPIWWVRISDNPEEQQDKPRVLYTSLIHAREGIGVQQMMFFMLHLLENYETNSEVKNLVDNYELYFVPVVNPDGYMYNEQNSPNGGGMWRKNRRNNGGSFGVDINRNFGYMWGIDNNGSSPNPSSETYRGPAAFSEPETDNLRMICESIDFQIALNYHSYSNLLLYPWGYTTETCPDNELFHAHATLMTQDNNYTIGPGSTTIYATNGGSDDWMYGEQETKNAIFSYTPELGSSSDGFWPSINRIVPLCQENMLQNFLAGFLSGNYGHFTDNSPAIFNAHDFYLNFDLQRLGFGETEEWLVSIEPLDENIISVGDPVSIGYLEILESLNDSIWIQLNPDLLSGSQFRFVVHLDNGSFVQSDTLTKFYGVTSIIFQDDGNTFNNWFSNKWNSTNSTYYSPTGSITDSPNGNYSNNEYNPVVLVEPIDLTNTSFALLTFMAKWDIEPGYDYVQLLARSEGSLGWTPLEGKYTRSGSSNQAPGQPLYDGTSDWVQEEIDLTEFVGNNLLLSFVLRSDAFVTGDGFYFDDMEIIVMDIETAINDPLAGKPKLMGKVYPNPASKAIYVPLHVNSNAYVEISDLTGRNLFAQLVDASITRLPIDISNLEKGVYFVRITTADAAQVEKFVVN
jgi:carboxypeptidase T